MATVHLTDPIIRRLEPPATGNKITYDTAVKGFGARVTANGVKSFILTYTVRGSGRQRRYTIGGCDRWTATDARQRAKELKAEIDQGGDPLGDIEAEREAPTIAELFKRFRAEHLPRLRPTVRDDYERMIKQHVLEHLSEKMKVADVAFEDVDRLHQRITKTAPYRANRVVTLLSKAFSLAIKWKWRTDNPCKGVTRNVEHHRERYLSGAELTRLTDALAKADRDVADVIRLLLLTGARRGEVLSMKYENLDLGLGLWKKPPGSTKQKKSHEVPLSAPACQLLADRLSRKTDDGDYVFPGSGRRGYVVNVWRQWAKILRDAKIENFHIHDLRHSFASELVSAGHSLPMIASLLGHQNVQTTSRYSHLYRDARREAVERVGRAVTGANRLADDPTPLRRGRP
jgi:integrase